MKHESIVETIKATLSSGPVPELFFALGRDEDIELVFATPTALGPASVSVTERGSSARKRYEFSNIRRVRLLPPACAACRPPSPGPTRPRRAEGAT